MTVLGDRYRALTSRFHDAFVVAASLHQNQTRKGTPIPYVAHLMSVAALVLEDGGTEDEAIAALLHDAVEDQGGAATRDVIARLYGANVAEIVDGCSDTDVVPKPPWQKRKEDYIAHLSMASSSILRVSLADKVHNARAVLADYRVVGERLWSRFNGGREGTLWYYRALADKFAELSPGPLSDELTRIVDDLERTVAG